MAKFGKVIKEKNNSNGPFKDKYMNYKALKQLIKKILKNRKELNNNGESNENDLNQLEQLNNVIKEFTELLEQEMKKVFIFFINKERKLYKDINQHLYQKDNFNKYQLGEYLNEFSKLSEIATNSLNLSEFVYYNNLAMMKILKKFDHKIIGKDKKNYITKGYIQNKLEEQNSDILYMLKFKMIDEVNVIIDDLIHLLKKKFENNKSKLSNNLKNQEFIQGKLIEDLPDFSEISNRLMKSYNDIKIKIKIIDKNCMEVKKLYMPWDDYLKISNELNNKLLQLKENITDNTSIYISNEINNIENESTTSYADIYQKTMNIIKSTFLSKENKYNILLIFIQTLLFTFSYSVVIPNNTFFINNLGYFIYYNGIIMGMTPLGMLFSISYETFCFQKSSKIPILFSFFFMAVSNLLYCLSNKYENLILIIISRFLLGISNHRTNNKVYLTNFLPKNKVNLYIIYFHVISMFGLIIGFGFNLIFNDIQINKFINQYTLGTCISFILSLILFLLTIFVFKETNTSKFNILNFNDKTNETNETIRRDTIMINDINEQLGDFNKKSNYNDTNLVSKTVTDITTKEKETMQYLYKPFFVYLSIILVSKITYESMIIMTSIYYFQIGNKIKSALILFFSIILLLICELINIKRGKLISDRNMILILLCFMVIINILLFLLKKYDEISFIVLIILGFLEELISSKFFTKIILDDYIFCEIQGNIVLNIFGNLGRVIGAVSPIFIGISSYQIVKQYIHLSLFILCIISIGLFGYYYHDMRVKAIRRVLEREENDKFIITAEI